MATYTLTVLVDQAWIAQFNTKGYKLCFASGVMSGKINYNVVAYTTTSAASVTITWTDEYHIAASRDHFSNGAKFTASTNIQPISFGQSFQLPTTWVDMLPNFDPLAPAAGFRFDNRTIASAVVYKKVNDVITPIYISQAGPLPPGHEDLTPKAMCAVWFSADAETQQMISDYDTDPIYIDLTGKTAATVKYDSNGIWMNV